MAKQVAPLKFSMQLPCTSEFVGVARLALSGIATRMNFTVEEIEDIKISVSEACTNCVQYAYEDGAHNLIEIDTYLHPTFLEIIVRDSGKGFDVAHAISQPAREAPVPGKLGLGLGLTFMRNLMDVSEVTSEPGRGTTVRLVKNVPTATTASA